MAGWPRSLLRRWGVLGYTALVFAVGGLVPVANGQAPDPTPGSAAVPTPDPAPVGPPRRVTKPPPVVRRAAPVVQAPRYVPPRVVVTAPTRPAARPAPAARRAMRARTPAKSQTVVHSVPRDPPLTLATGTGLVFEEPDRAATTFAVLALFAVILASGSFLGVLVEVRRNLR